jgi:hypothetical protein
MAIFNDFNCIKTGPKLDLFQETYLIKIGFQGNNFSSYWESAKAVECPTHGELFHPPFFVVTRNKPNCYLGVY